MTFEQIFATARRIVPYALIGAVALGLLALGYSLVTPKLYQATARVIVEPRTRTVVANDQDVMSSLPQRDPTVVDTEVEFLESLAVAERVVKEQQLVRDPEFGDSTPEKTAVKFQAAMSVQRAGPTYLIDIGVLSRSPQRAAALANASARAYLALQRERKREATSNANTLLSNRVRTMETELRRAEDAVQAYRVANNLMSVNGTTLAEQTAAQLSQQLADARGRERAALAELAAARGAGVSLDSANAQGSLGTLRAQQATARQEMSAAAARYGPNHPTYIAAAQRLREIDAAVAGETSRARAAVAANRQSLVADLAAKAAAATNLRRSIEGSAGNNQAGLTRNSRSSSELGELERKAAALRSTYEAYLERYRQTTTQLGTEQADSSVVSEALTPSKPARPNTRINLLLGLLLGGAIGVSIAVIRMLFESHFSTSNQIENELDVDALPILPTIKSAKLPVRRAADPLSAARAMLEDTTGTFAEMHTNLLASLNRPVDGGANQVVLLTSSLPREGKTTAAVCLATMSAQLGRRTVLIDFDQRRRGTTRALVDDPAVGVAQVIDGTATLESVTITTDLGGFDLIPASKLKGNAAGIFEHEGLQALLTTLRGKYDLVLLDSAPILPIADSRILAKYADSILMLCRWRSTPRKAVEQALALLGESATPIAGVALTQVDLNRQATLGYGDQTFYYSKYKEYYHTAV